MLRDHVETNDVELFSVDRLREVKTSHEATYAGGKSGLTESQIDDIVRSAVDDHRRRLADAAERIAQIEAAKLRLNEDRGKREAAVAAEENAPRWGPTGEGEDAWFVWDGSRLQGRVKNTGRSEALSRFR